MSAAQQAIGRFVRAARDAQHLTQEQVAAMTKGSPWQLSRAAISAIERGQNFPGMEAMLALSHVLYIDPKQLVERARMSTAVPVDVTGLAYETLEARASEYFWAGDFRMALSVYDAMLEVVALEAPDDPARASERAATIEVRRATALKRAGALLSSIASAERAISLSNELTAVQAEAYIVLADLQCHRGNLPLARDASQRAVELCSESGPQTKGWAWMVKGRVHFLAGEFEPARQAFLEARREARAAGDSYHMTHIEGDIGMCWLAMGERTEARKWVRRAVELSRQQGQPTLEASWLIELGKMSLDGTQPDEAESYAKAALRIAKPREHHLTIFRAEWLRHRIVRHRDPASPDRHRVAYLRKLFLHLDQHEGIEEVQQFRTAMRSLAAESRKST